MTVSEQIERLSITVENDVKIKEMKEALKLYHELVKSGEIIPRKNQISEKVSPRLFGCNYFLSNKS